MENSLELKLKAKKIKLAAFDIDGVMTDGSLFYTDSGEEFKAFNAKDGLGLSMLLKAGIKTAIITAKNSASVQKRAEVLSISKLFMGQKNKILALNELVEEFKISKEEILYMGDDLPDLETLLAVGFSACPKDAVNEVINSVDFVCKKNGGKGAVREVCDFLLKSKGICFEDLKKPSVQ